MVSALYRTSKLQYRRSAVVPRSGIRVVHLTRRPQCLFRILQTRHLQIHLQPYSHQLAIDKLQVTYWAVIICANTAESAPESRATGQPTDPEHTGWLVRTSPPGHRLPGLLNNSARRHGVVSQFQAKVLGNKLYGQFLACSMPRLHPRRTIEIRWRKLRSMFGARVFFDAYIYYSLDTILVRILEKRVF